MSTLWDNMELLKIWLAKFNPLEEDPPYVRLMCIMKHYFPKFDAIESQLTNAHALDSWFDSRLFYLGPWLELMTIYPEICPFPMDVIEKCWNNVYHEYRTGNVFSLEIFRAKYPKKDFPSKAARENARFLALEKENAQLKETLVEHTKIIAILSEKLTALEKTLYKK